MTDLWQGLFYVYTPTLCVGAVFLVWSKMTEIGWLARLLRMFSIWGCVTLLILLVSAFAPGTICEGHFIARFQDSCPRLGSIQRIALYLAFVGYAFAVLASVLIITAGGLVELLRPTNSD